MSRTIDRLPWADLEEAVRIPTLFHDRPTRMDWARHLDVAVQTIDRWRTNGIPWYTADHLAVKYFDRHPGAIWLDWWNA